MVVNGTLFLRLRDDPPSAPVLKMWRDAGFPLGNHTFSHDSPNAVGADGYIADDGNFEWSEPDDDGLGNTGCHSRP